MLKFSIHQSLSETDLRRLDVLDTSSQNSQPRDGDHNCHECNERRRALSKERTRNYSRPRERFNYNNNRCNRDCALASNSSSNYDTSDGKDSTTTSNSEMSTTSNSFYKRFQLRSRSKSKDVARTERRSESPEASLKNSEKSTERRGRRGIWELQKAAARVIGPESRVGRWVGKLRSRSSEARLSSLKSRYSEIRDWEGWKLEDDMPVEQVAIPKLMVNDRSVCYGKKITRSRSTDAVSWTPRLDSSRDVERDSPVRKPLEEAVNNKIGILQKTGGVPRHGLHSRFKSEPNMARRHLYDGRRNERSQHFEDESRTRVRDARGCKTQTYDQRYERTPHTQVQSRQSCKNSIDRIRDCKQNDYDDSHCDASNNGDEDRYHGYQKNQHVPSRNSRKPSSGQRYLHSRDSQRDIRRKRGGHIYEKRSHNSNVVPVGEHNDCHGQNARYGSRGHLLSPQSRKDIAIPYSNCTPSKSNRHDTNFDQRVTQKPVRAHFTPPLIVPNEAYVKQCSVKRSPVDSVSTVLVNKEHANNLSTNVSMSCTALQEINSEHILKRYERQLTCNSLSSLSLESLDSGTSCSGDRSSSNCSDNMRSGTRISKKLDDHSNILVRPVYSTDSGYKSPGVPKNVKKDWKELETMILSSCFRNEAERATQKPVINTSDYESESGFEEKSLPVADNSKYRFQQTSSMLRSTERLRKGEDDRGPYRRTPKKVKETGHTLRSSDTKKSTYDLHLSTLTTKVRARLGHKAMSKTEMSVHRGDTLYLNRDDVKADALWVRAYSSITGDVGLIPRVILSSRMEDFV